MKTRELLETGNECEFLVQDIGKTESMGDGLTRIYLCSNKGAQWSQVWASIVMSQRAMLQFGRELIRLASSNEADRGATHPDIEWGETAH